MAGHRTHLLSPPAHVVHRGRRRQMKKRGLGLVALTVLILATGPSVSWTTGLTYAHPTQGWTLEVIHRVDYGDLHKFHAADLAYEAMDLGQEFRLNRAMGREFADYLYCLITLPVGHSDVMPGRGSRAPSFGVVDHFVAVMQDSSRVKSERLLFTDGPMQSILYTTDRSRISLDGFLKLARDRKTGRVVCFIQFPLESVDPERLVRLELHQINGGDYAWR